MNKAARRAVYNSEKWKSLRRRYAQVTGERCQACGGPAHLRSAGGARGDLDHIIDLADGGAPYDPANLQWICIRCHARKTNPKHPAMPDDWRNLIE